MIDAPRRSSASVSKQWYHPVGAVDEFRTQFTPFHFIVAGFRIGRPLAMALKIAIGNILYRVASKTSRSPGAAIEAAIAEDTWFTARRLIERSLENEPASHWLLTRLALTYDERFE